MLTAVTSAFGPVADGSGDFPAVRSARVALLSRAIGGTLGAVYGRRVIRR